MLYESFMLPRNKLAERRWADESGEEIGAWQKILAVVLSVAIAGSTVLVVAMPFALLHLK